MLFVRGYIFFALNIVRLCTHIFIINNALVIHWSICLFCMTHCLSVPTYSYLARTLPTLYELMTWYDQCQPWLASAGINQRDLNYTNMIWSYNPTSANLIYPDAIYADPIRLDPTCVRQFIEFIDLSSF